MGLGLTIQNRLKAALELDCKLVWKLYWKLIEHCISNFVEIGLEVSLMLNSQICWQLNLDLTDSKIEGLLRAGLGFG